MNKKETGKSRGLYSRTHNISEAQYRQNRRNAKLLLQLKEEMKPIVKKLARIRPDRVIV